ncbi:MAG: monovalent cation/H(+) antiporter subunit G [Oscillospiraceae bacterium]|nr:monovalent cation/H(+) antiporter subunit G [Oscillospiraceae bacterium]
MIEWFRFILTAVLLALGVGSILLSLLGVFRFRFVMNRMHCAAITDSLGALCIVAALAVAAGSWSYLPKLGLILVFLWVGSPLSSHLVSRLEISTDETVSEHMEEEDTP